MNDKLWLKNTGAVLVLFLVFPFCQNTDLSEKGSQRFLPEGIDGWRRHGEVLEYEGEGLFDYINGGAEIYYEYGFVRVIVQDYMTADEHTLTLEIYEMENPESAFGIYSFKRSSGGSDAGIGGQSRLEDYYLNFWKGTYLVTLTGFDQETVTIQGLLSIARAVAEAIPEGGAPPSLVNILPSQGRVEAGLKYFKGLLGLYNNYTFAQEDIFSLERGVKVDYVSGVSLFLFHYSETDMAAAAFQKSRAFFDSSPRYSEYDPLGAEKVRMFDNQGRLLVMEAFPHYLVVVLAAQSLESAEELLTEIRAGLQLE
jgi:hypothetical protein